MSPWSHDKQVGRSGVRLRDCLIGAEGACKVFRVEPASNIQDWAMDVVQMLRDVARPPVLVEGVVLDVFVEE